MLIWCTNRYFAGVTAHPMCALENRQTGDKYCVLICQPSAANSMLRVKDDQCGDGGSCQPACNGIGVCTFDE